jgi:hypothetical protein
MTIKIYRGTTLIADASMAKVNGFPLSDCGHAIEMPTLARALQPDVLDRFAKTNSVTLEISREFSQAVRAMDHATRGPQTGSGKYDLVIVADDDGITHTWTLSDRTATGAAWKQAKATACLGVRAAIAYTITVGRWAYAGPLAGTYADGITDDAPGDGILIDTGALTLTP